eukprot:scaffold91255_cov75-Attheya_sp.AAC.1
MDITQNKFDDLVQDRTWNRPSGEQEQLIALTATIEHMARNYLHPKKAKVVKKKQGQLYYPLS